MKSRLEIEEALASKIAHALQSDINEFGDAILLVSGGNTPKGLFESLSLKDIDWEKVGISLVDERFLPEGCSDQNGTLIKNYLLKNYAAKATFYPMVINPLNLNENLKLYKESIAQIRKPITAVVLGMGTDGHTASFFPDSDELNEAIEDLNNSEVIIANTSKSPYPRITFTYKVLANAKHLYLHFYGDEKMKILEEAKSNKGYLPYPIQQFINEVKDIEIYSTI